MLLHNINVSKGWCNGTRVRLLPSFSWTGEPKTLKPETNPETGVSTFVVDQVRLAEEAKHPEFNVKVVKDEDIVSKKTICYKDSHVHFVSVRTGESVCKGGRIAWKQVQGLPAYAVTVHKAQGLTMNLVYLALSKVFGFGLAYTALTRCPYEWAILMVGVPPRDVLRYLLTKDSEGQTLIDRKRIEITALLDDPMSLVEHLKMRIH